MRSVDGSSAKACGKIELLVPPNSVKARTSSVALHIRTVLYAIDRPDVAVSRYPSLCQYEYSSGGSKRLLREGDAEHFTEIFEVLWRSECKVSGQDKTCTHVCCIETCCRDYCLFHIPSALSLATRLLQTRCQDRYQHCTLFFSQTIKKLTTMLPSSINSSAKENSHGQSQFP